MSARLCAALQGPVEVRVRDALTPKTLTEGATCLDDFELAPFVIAFHAGVIEARFVFPTVHARRVGRPWRPKRLLYGALLEQHRFDV